MNLQNPTLRYQLAQVEGETVGLIGLQLQFPLNFNAWIGEVQELVVLPQRRGLHVGQALLAWRSRKPANAVHKWWSSPAENPVPTPTVSISVKGIRKAICVLKKRCEEEVWA